MLNNLTTKFQEALMQAQQTAGRLGKPEISSLDVLVALLEQEGGILSPILRKASCDPGLLLQAAQREVSHEPTQSGATTQPQMGRDLATVMQAAEEERKKLKDDYLSVEHFMLGALDTQNKVHQLTDTFGLTKDNYLAAMKEVRGNQRVTDDNPEGKYQTLEKYVSSHVAQDCADGLNLLIRNYNAGVQITYKLYSEQEIAEDSSRNNVEFYYYPASTPDAKYALVLSGNILNRTAELKECISTAYQLHQKGYAVFVMRYRAYPDNDNNSPMEDIARAVKYITGHAQQFGVQTESYALIGYSSGGHLAGMFASDALGYKNYGLPKPGAVILAYPIVQFAEITPIYRVGIDPFVCGRFYYEYSLADLITEDYPPVYFWYGRDDLTLNLLCWPLQGPALSKALTAHGVPYKEVVYDHAAHGIGLGRGTAADGWLDEAVAFWEEQTK